MWLWHVDWVQLAADRDQWLLKCRGLLPFYAW